VWKSNWGAKVCKHSLVPLVICFNFHCTDPIFTSVQELQIIDERGMLQQQQQKKKKKKQRFE
jgi:hypothetical protein